MKELIKRLLRGLSIKEWKEKREIRKRLEELKKRDPFIYK
jgi:hypothetical protein